LLARDGYAAIQEQVRSDLEDQTGPEDLPPPASRHALLGLIFETADKFEGTGSRAWAWTAKTTSPVSNWARKSRLLAPARRRLDSLATRGEQEVSRWVERGRIEEARSHVVAEETMGATMGASLDFVAQHPQVQELVQTQSTGLTAEIAEELRERAVSADLVLQRVVDRLRRRRPRKWASSKADPTTTPSLLDQPAGFVSRLLAFIADAILVSVSFVLTGWIVESMRSIIGIQISLDQVSGPFSDLSGSVPSLPTWQFVGLSLSGTSIFAIICLLFFWTVGGKTPGKALMGLRVVASGGRGLSFFRSILRLLGYGLSTLFLYAGFLWIIIDRRNMAWHDHLAGTRVVYAWEARPEERFLAELLEDLTEP
jgi:uncharacterized RDD family membrane protein YckC